jgi:hypothetical protein
MHCWQPSCLVMVKASASNAFISAYLALASCVLGGAAGGGGQEGRAGGGGMWVTGNGQGFRI